VPIKGYTAPSSSKNDADQPASVIFIKKGSIRKLFSTFISPGINGDAGGFLDKRAEIFAFLGKNTAQGGSSAPITVYLRSSPVDFGFPNVLKKVLGYSR